LAVSYRDTPGILNKKRAKKKHANVVSQPKKKQSPDYATLECPGRETAMQGVVKTTKPNPFAIFSPERPWVAMRALLASAWEAFVIFSPGSPGRRERL
jgi:hypothetical protein